MAPLARSVFAAAGHCAPLVQPRALRYALGTPRRGFAGTVPGGGSGGGGGRPCQLKKLFAVPHWRLARKTEEDLQAEHAGSDGTGPRFPFKDEFEINRDLVVSGQQVIETLLPLMMPDRVRRIEQVCAARTFNVLPVVEHVFDMGNLAAICRSADALGFGAVHVVRNVADTRYKQSKRASAGADKWLDVQVYDSTAECLQRAKALGYQVVVTHLSPAAVDISQVDWTRPTAFVLGNEEKGVSAEALALADACVAVPMVGFVESFNISVAASLIMYEARRTREQRLGTHGDLSAEEQRLLKAVLFLRNKGQTREYIQEMLSRPPPQWQAHRGGGDWGGKEFAAGSSGSDADSSDAERRWPPSCCHYWDGAACWGERYLWPGGHPCRYEAAHTRGRNTLNREKLKQMCVKRGLPLPDLSAPPPLPPNLVERQQLRDAAAAAEAGVAAAAAADAQGAFAAHEALMEAARSGAAAAAVV